MKNCDLLRASSLLVISAALVLGQTKPALDAKYGNLPLSFEANRGQTDAQVRYLSRGQGYSLFLTDSEAVLSLQEKGKAGDVVRMQLSGANRKPLVSGMDELPGKSNYFIGNDPSKWRRDVPNYRRVQYKDVYPGVDLVYYGNQRRLEYDFVVAPGADPKPIRLKFPGVRRLSLDRGGDLSISSENGEVRLKRPVVYQMVHGKRSAIDGKFELEATNTVGFRLGGYNHTQTVIIDPALTYSTFLGGGGTGSSGTAIKADAEGNAYVVGTTFSPDFPVTSGAFQTVNKGGQNDIGNLTYQAFISKLNPTGSTLIYSTYLGGSGNVITLGEPNRGDTPYSISVDSAGDVYVAGAAFSTDFPITAGAFQTVNKGGANGVPNGFVTKLNPSGTALIYSTYLGGSGLSGYTGPLYSSIDEVGGDWCYQIAVDASGSAYVTGVASSNDFPVTSGAFQSTNKGYANGFTTAFVTKLNPSGSALAYSTYFGGSHDDGGAGIAVDSAGNTYVAGATGSTDFPVTAGAFQTTNHAAAIGSGNGFISKINAAGSGLIYSTYLGGSGNANGPANNNNAEVIVNLALDSTGNVYVSGLTGSADFPVTSGAFQSVNKSLGSVSPATLFVTKLNPAGSGLIYSTYLGSSGGDYNGPSGLAIDSNGNTYLTGYTLGTDFPVTPDAFQSSNNCILDPSVSTSIRESPFLVELNASGSSLVYSTYFGGSGNPSTVLGITIYSCDSGAGIAQDGTGNVYVTGNAASPDFPITPAAFQTTKTADSAFIAKFNLGITTTTSTITALTSTANPQNIGLPVTFTAKVISTSSGAPTGNVVFSVDGSAVATLPLNSSDQATYTTSTLPAGPHTVAAVYSGDATFSTSSATLSETITNNVTVTVGTVPAGLSFSVDGNTYVTIETFSFVSGSQHSITVSSPQGSAGTQSTFVSWSDGGAQTHTITATDGGSYAATFSVGYLLSNSAVPVLGGTVAPPSGYYPAGTSVSLTATPNSGYTFSGWSGNVANSTAASTSIVMSGPESVIASFGPSGAAGLFGSISSKSGPSGARIWSVEIGNSGPAAAVGAGVGNIRFAQAGGVPCTPTVTSALPVSGGSLAPGASVTVPVTLNFSGCAANSRFTVTVSLSANSGAASGSIVRLNQFQ